MLKRGEPSAVMTKLLNDSSGYLTAYASLAAVAYLIYRKGHHVVSGAITVTGLICGVVFFCYWIGHVVSLCEQLRDKHQRSKAAMFHSSLIMFIFILAYPGMIAVTIYTVINSIK